MDSKNILDNIKLYTNLQQNKKKVKAIELGLSFLDLFYKELKQMESLSFDEKCSDITDIKIFNYKQNSFTTIKVSSKLFQEQLQFLYRDFLENNYFINFSWYKNFSQSIEKFLKKKYNYDSVSAINAVITFVSDCFRFFSTGFNDYDYNEICTFLSKTFFSIGFNEYDSKDFSSNILENLIEEKLIIVTSKFFLKKKFKLSDNNMDIVFNLNSIKIGYVSHFSSSKKFDLKEILKNLSDFIEDYNTNWNTRLSVIQLTPLMLRDYPKLMTELFDYSILNVNSSFFDKAPKHIQDSVLGYFFYKILLNEYCLQLVMLSCFEHCFLDDKLRNILNNTDYLQFFKKIKK